METKDKIWKIVRAIVQRAAVLVGYVSKMFVAGNQKTEYYGISRIDMARNFEMLALINRFVNYLYPVCLLNSDTRTKSLPFNCD